MNLRFVTKKLHALLDYPVALSLMFVPFALSLGGSHPAAKWLAVGTGVAALVLTILTDHQTGLIRVLPYRVHLAVDFAVGLVFIAAPLAFGFSGIDAWYYFANGAAVLVVVGLHKDEVTASDSLALA